MNIHPIGIIFWVGLIAWVIWKIKKYFDNQRFAEELMREGRAEYSAMTPEQRRAEDQRAENSIKLRPDSNTDDDPVERNLKAFFLTIAATGFAVLIFYSPGLGIIIAVIGVALFILN